MNKKLIISLILVIIWMVLIFFFSNMNSDLSNENSQSIIITIINKIDEIIKSSEEVILRHHSKEFIETANFIFRKLCHISEYLVLSVLILNFLSILKKYTIKKNILIAMIVSILYSISDEFHQIFISGRSGQVMDVLIDTFGAIVGAILFCFIFNKKMSNKENN